MAGHIDPLLPQIMRLAGLQYHRLPGDAFFACALFDSLVRDERPSSVLVVPCDHVDHGSPADHFDHFDPGSRMASEDLYLLPMDPSMDPSHGPLSYPPCRC